MTKVRAKNLGDAEIAEIVSILDGWTGKLSWDLLIESIEARKLGRYTRQALHKHARIYMAFGVTKKRLAGSEKSETKASEELDPELQVALQRIARLEAENLRLKAENDRLLEQFACWAYHAHTKGLSKEFLSQPLPRVDREQSKRKAQSTRRRASR